MIACTQVECNQHDAYNYGCPQEMHDILDTELLVDPSTFDLETE